MRRKRFPPDDPREWLNRARSNVSRAQRDVNVPTIYLEDVCFDAQQAAEKAIKAVMLFRGVTFPYVHDLARLLTLLSAAGHTVPASVIRAQRLSRFAVEARYPGLSGPISRRQAETAVRSAIRVVAWAERQISPPKPKRRRK
jgi:HEPN domain-containing protein